MNEDAIKRLQQDTDFMAFQEFIVSEIEKLDSVENLGKLSNEQAGEEAKVRAKAREKLYDILAPFLNQRSKKEPTTAELQKAKDKFGL